MDAVELHRRRAASWAAVTQANIDRARRQDKIYLKAVRRLMALIVGLAVFIFGVGWAVVTYGQGLAGDKADVGVSWVPGEGVRDADVYYHVRLDITGPEVGTEARLRWRQNAPGGWTSSWWACRRSRRSHK